jgi:hypothetical protein
VKEIQKNVLLAKKVENGRREIRYLYDILVATSTSRGTSESAVSTDLAGDVAVFTLLLRRGVAMGDVPIDTLLFT